jgi:hypothetical protein
MYQPNDRSIRIAAVWAFSRNKNSLSGTLKFPAEAGTKIPSIKHLLVLHKQGVLGMVNNSHPQASNSR